MTRLRKRIALLIGSLLLLSLPGQTARTSPRAEATVRPNIVFILTDDQRWDTMDAMPKTRSLIQDKGMTFTNAFVSNSSCCPSRATFLKGAYSHTTNVYTNTNGPHGGFKAFRDSSTVATFLHGAGYRTGLVGKYLNGYPVNSGYIPPGWDRWFAFGGDTRGYYNYTVSDQGTPRSYGSGDAAYSTDVFAGKADDFIRTTSADTPLFLYLAVHAPHGPATPPTRYRNAFSTLPAYHPPSYNEADVSDKPAYIQAIPQNTWSEHFRRQQYRTLLAVDDAVETVVTALSDTGRLANTMIVFASDNGITWMEHRLKNTKFTPYEEAARIPFMVRFDPLVAPGSTDAHLVANIDFAPTVLDIAGVTPPAMDGISLVPLLDQTATTWRTEFLLEHCCTEGGPQAPSYCGLRTAGYSYIEYATGEKELYDLTADPYQLQNVASDPGNDALEQSLHVKLQALCNPPPPQFASGGT